MKFEPDYDGDNLFGFSLVPDAGPITYEDIMNNTVKALSWKSPFGEMMLHGKIETRSWGTDYRGLTLICLSKKGYDMDEVLEMSGQKMQQQIIQKTINEETLNGHAIAIGRLVHSRQMVEKDEAVTFVKFKGQWFEKKKNKSGIIIEVKKRQHCHIYTDVRRIVPFQWTGQQTWKELSSSEKSMIRFK